MKHEGTFREYIEELEERKFELASELCWTPFFMFKKIWILKARISQLRKDISLALLYDKSNKINTDKFQRDKGDFIPVDRTLDLERLD